MFVDTKEKRRTEKLSFLSLSFVSVSSRKDDKEQFNSLVSTLTTSSSTGDLSLKREVLLSGEVNANWSFYSKEDSLRVKEFDYRTKIGIRSTFCLSLLRRKLNSLHQSLNTNISGKVNEVRPKWNSEKKIDVLFLVEQPENVVEQSIASFIADSVESDKFSAGEQ